MTATMLVLIHFMKDLLQNIILLTCTLAAMLLACMVAIGGLVHLFKKMIKMTMLKLDSRTQNDLQVLLFWPTCDDKCWVPLQHVLLKLTVPTTRNGRMYEFFRDEINN